MAVKTFYLAAGNDGNFAALVDGVAQAAASRTDGWTVAKIASGSSDYDVGVKQLSTTFAAPAKPTTLLTGAAANAFKTPAPLTGAFANTNWVLTFAFRATVVSAQSGAIRMRVFKSANADGSAATELSAGILTATNTAVLSTTADGTSVCTWLPLAPVSLNNEYLFFAIAWIINAQGGSNTADALFRTGSTGPAGTRIVTPDFVAAQAATPTGLGSAQSFGTVSTVITRAPQSLAVGSLGSAQSFGTPIAVQPEANPPPVSDYKGRWDASDPASLTLSGTPARVLAIADKSTQGRNMVTAVGNAPSYDDTINGVTVPRFNGLVRQESLHATFPSTKPNQTVFVVAKLASANQTCGIWGGDRYGSEVGMVGGSLRIVATYQTEVVVHPTKPVVGKPFLASFVYDNVSAKLRLDGIEASAAYANGFAAADSVWSIIGATWSGNLDGSVAEVIYFDRTLSPAEVTAMETWLTAKWFPGPAQIVPVAGVFPPGYVASIVGEFLVGDGHLVGGSVAAQFGVPTVTGVVPAQQVQPAGVASAQSFGPLAFRVTLGTGGVLSAQAFGAVTTKAVVTRAVGGLGSAQSFGILSFRVTLGGGGVSTAQAFGSPTLKSVFTCTVVGLPSAQSFGSVSTKAVVTRAVTGLGSAQAFGAISVGGASAVAVAGKTSAQAFGSVTVSARITRTVSGLGSAQQFAVVTIRAAITRTVGGVGSAQAFGAVTLASSGGPQTKPVGGLGSAQAFGLLAPSAGSAQTVQVPGLDHGFLTFHIVGTWKAGQAKVGWDGEYLFGRPVFGMVYVLGGVGSAQSFGTLRAYGGPVWVTVGGVGSAQAFGTPSAYRVWVTPLPPDEILLTPVVCADATLTLVACADEALAALEWAEQTLAAAAEEDLVLAPSVEE